MVELIRKYVSVEDYGEVQLLGRKEVEKHLRADVTQPDLVFAGGACVYHNRSEDLFKDKD